MDIVYRAIKIARIEQKEQSERQSDIVTTIKCSTYGLKWSPKSPYGLRQGTLTLILKGEVSVRLTSLS